MRNCKQWQEAAQKVEEEVPANNAGNVSMPADVQADKARKKKKLYDGRTREGKKFFERILARREAAKKRVEAVNKQN